MSRQLLLFLIVLALGACKVTVIVPRGGEVQSTVFPSGSCPELDNCVFDITDSNFMESFTAAPQAGFHFIKWNNGGNFLCEDSTNIVCVIDTTPASGLVPDAIIDALGDYYIMPIFSDKVAIAESDTITVGGRKWVQPDLLTNLSRNDVDAVCPFSAGGVCDGSLNGWDVGGWTWASVNDVNDLFTVYISPAIIGPGPGGAMAPDSAWAPAFFNAGWRPTTANVDRQAIAAWTSTPATGSDGFYGEIRDYILPSELDSVRTDLHVPFTYTSALNGVWLYRVP